MYQDASYAALPTTEGGFARPATAAPTPSPEGLTWRHVATGGLLLVTLPVFAVAALACLPVLLVAAGGQSLWRGWRLARHAAPRRDATLTPSH